MWTNLFYNKLKVALKSTDSKRVTPASGSTLKAKKEIRYGKRTTTFLGSNTWLLHASNQTEATSGQSVPAIVFNLSNTLWKMHSCTCVTPVGSTFPQRLHSKSLDLTLVLTSCLKFETCLKWIKTKLNSASKFNNKYNL